MSVEQNVPISIGTRYPCVSTEASDVDKRELEGLAAAKEQWLNFSQTVPGQNTVFRLRRCRWIGGTRCL